MLLSLVNQMVAVGNDAGVVLVAAINVADRYECKEHRNEYPEGEYPLNQDRVLFPRGKVLGRDSLRVCVTASGGSISMVSGS